MFASQASLIVMAPVLADAANDLHVSTSTAGQLRTAAGLAAAVTALLASRAGHRFGLGRLLLAAASLLALASIASAAAPSFAVLLAAQLPLGIAVAVITTSATLAAAEWVAPELRTRTLSWTLVGQPAAWIVGMPLAGVLGEHSWRFAWLALPLTASLLAAALVAPRGGDGPSPVPPVSTRAALADATIARWLTAELFANAGWAGTLVYAGALFAQSYGTTGGETGCLLALAAGAYVAGNLASRRLVEGDSRLILLAFTLTIALLVALFGLMRTGIEASALLLAAASFGAGGRTLVTSSFALGLAPGIRPAATSLRAATMQFGYFIGALVGGCALALGGYRALGVAMGALFFAAAPAYYRSFTSAVAGHNRDAVDSEHQRSTKGADPMHVHLVLSRPTREHPLAPGLEARRRAQRLLHIKAERSSRRRFAFRGRT
jgi:predicted MFS family arabinose efflux permease